MKHRLLRALLLPALCCVMPAAFAQTITNVVVTPGTVCPGGTIGVTFTRNAMPGNANESAQLSDASGSFATPVTLTGPAPVYSGGGASGAISNLTIPAGTPAGTGYKVRITSTFAPGPVVSAGTALTVSAAVGAPVFSNTLQASGYQNGPDITFEATATGGTVQYSLTQNPVTPTVTINAGTGKVSFPAQFVGNIAVTATAAGCGGPTTATFNYNVLSNTIATGSLGASYLQGANLSVPFTVNGNFSTGNQFTAQLSDASGSFATPVSIGTLTGTGSGTIPATIPVGTPLGTGYRIRVISSIPVITGTDNGTNIAILSCAPTAFNVTGGGSFCLGGIGLSIGLSGSETGVSYQLVNALNQPIGSAIAGTGAAISFGLIITAGNYTVLATRTTGFCTTTMTGGALISINAPPTASISGTTAICPGGSAPINFSGTPAGSTIHYNINGGADQTIVLNGSGTASVTAAPAANATYTITSVVSPASCTSTISGQSATVTVNPVPVYTASAPVICSGDATSIPLGSNLSGSKATWTVTPGSNVSGASDNATPASGNLVQTLSITSTTQESVIYNITPLYTAAGTTCAGTTVPVTVLVNPVPVYTPVTPAVFCSGGTTSIPLGSNVPGALASWTLGTNNGTGGASANPTPSAGPIAQVLTNTGSGAGSITYTITPVFTASGKSCSGAAKNVTQGVNPIPSYNGPASSYVCSGSTTSIALSATASGATFGWDVSSNPGGIVGALAGNGGVLAQPLYSPVNNAVRSVIYAVTPTYTAGGKSCTGSAALVTVNVNPVPVMNTPASATICSGTFTNIALSASASGSTFSWTVGTNTGNIGGASDASGTSIVQQLTNPNNASIGSIVYNVKPTFTAGGTSCVGSSLPVTVNVSPKPAYNGPTSITICSGGNPNLVLTGSTASSFTWTTSNMVGTITGAQDGSGTSISDPLFNASHSAQASIVYNISISSSVNCTGDATPVTVTVNPEPQYTGPTNPAAICSGLLTNIALASSAPGSTFTWSVNAVNGSIIGALGGAGNTIAQLLSNNSSTTTGSVVYSIVPVFTGGGKSCQGPASLVTQPVNPTAILSPASGTYTICSGTSTNITLGSTASGSTYSWTVSNVNPLVTISGASAGNGGTIVQTLTDTSRSFSGTVQYDVTSTTGAGCPGGAASYIVQVNPRPKLINVAASQGICSGVSSNVVLSATVGSTFSWTTAAPASITAATIPSGNGGIIPLQPVSTNHVTTDTVTYYVTTVSTTSPACASIGPDSFKVGVNPKPEMNVAPNYQICSGTQTDIPLAASAPSNFSWTKSNESAGISGATNSSGDTIQQTLINSLATGANGSVQYNVVPTSKLAGCVGNSSPLTVTVRAVPLITNSNLFAKICSEDTVRIPLSANVNPYITKWTVSTSTLITGQRDDSTLTAPHMIMQKLVNNDLAHKNSDSITYAVRAISTSGGLRCEGTPVNFRVAVNPLPVLNLTNKTICSGDDPQIQLQPGISTPGLGVFKWTIGPAGPDITGATRDSAKSVISQILVNNRYDITETVQYNVNAQSAEGCNTTTSTPLIVTVNPLPKLLNANDTTICSESTLAFTPQPSVPLDSVKYDRTNISGRIQSFANVRPVAPFAINDQLSTNHYMLLDSLTYTFTLYSKNHCAFGGQTKKVYINPVPDTPGIQVAPASLCVNNQFVNFAAKRSAITSPSQEVFVWSSDNGSTILQLDSTNRQYALISFPDQGPATIMLRSKVKGANACWNKGSTRRVDVGPGSSSNPNVVYFSGNLVCQAPGVTHYQWGFDLKSDLSPTVLDGETNQNYKVDLASSNTRLYWVLATFGDGCTRKAYFNAPTLGTAPVASSGSAAISIYPNPATETITVELPLTAPKDLVIDIFDLAGKHLDRRFATDTKTRISVGNLTPGCYIVNCTQAGVRIATSRFIKN